MKWPAMLERSEDVLISSEIFWTTSGQIHDRRDLGVPGRLLPVIQPLSLAGQHTPNVESY